MALVHASVRDFSIRARFPGERGRRFGWAFVDQMIVSGANFLTGVLVGRQLGLEAFGVFSLAWMIVLFVQSLQNALVFSPMMNIGPKQTAAEAAGYYAVTLSHQLLMTLLASLFAVAICLTGAHVGLGEKAGILAAPLAISVLFIQMQEFLRRYNFTLGRLKRVLVSDLIRYGFLIVALLTPYWAPSVGSVLLLTGLTAGLSTLVLIPGLPTIRPDRAQFGDITRRHFHYSKWLVGSALLQWTTHQFFFIAAGGLLGPVAVGAMKASQNLVGVMHIFFQAAENILPQKAARAYQSTGHDGLRRFVLRILLLSGAGTGVVGLTLALPARHWLTLLYGQSYSEFGFVVVGFSVAYFLLACAIPLRFAFLAMERTHPVFTGYILATLFTVIACYPLICNFGVYGAVLGLVMTQAIMLGNLSFHYYQVRRL